MAILTSINHLRRLNEDEFSRINAQIAEYVTAGVTDGTKRFDGDYVLRTWTTQEAAQAWLDWNRANINPPPAIANVIIE